MNIPSTTEAALIFIYLLLSICTIQKLKKKCLSRGMRVLLDGFKQSVLKKKSTVEDNFLPFVKDDRVCD